MIDINKLDENITTPAICQDADDFYKMCVGTCSAVGSMPQDVMAVGMRVLLHDYLALVLTGELAPYQMHLSEENRVKARGAILTITERLSNEGVPMEEKDGKMKVDVEAAIGWAKENLDD